MSNILLSRTISRLVSYFILILSYFILILSYFILGKPCYIRLPDPSKKEKKIKKKNTPALFQKRWFSSLFCPSSCFFAFATLQRVFSYFSKIQKAEGRNTKNIRLEAHRKRFKACLRCFWYVRTTKSKKRLKTAFFEVFEKKCFWEGSMKRSYSMKPAWRKLRTAKIKTVSNVGSKQ